MIKRVKPIKRRVRRAPTGEQTGLFTGVVDDESLDAPTATKGAPLFQHDRPEKLYAGDRPLGEYLVDSGLKWIVELRALIDGLNYDAFIKSYDGRGRRPFHPRALVGLIVYGM